MRSLVTLAIATTIGAASAHAQSVWSPIQIPSTNETYLDNRSTCGNIEYIYFNEIGQGNNGHSVTYTVTNSRTSYGPWSLHVLPPPGYSPSFLVAVCKQRSGGLLSQCTDISGSSGLNNGLSGVNVPSQIGTYYITVTHPDFEWSTACGNYTLTGVHH